MRIQRFSDARKKVPSWHKRPGQLLCTYIRILWLKRCCRYEAGHPSTVTSETVTPSVDMALDGERDPVRRPAARVRASVSVSRTSPLNKGKTSPSKVAKRRPVIKEPPPVPQRQEPVVDRRGNLHDPNTGNFIGRTAKGAADLPPPESGRSSPETHTSFRSTASFFNIVTGDTDDDDVKSPGTEMIDKLQDAETSVGTIRAELEAANANVDLFRAEMQSEVITNAEALRAEFTSELRAEMKASSEMLRSELRSEARTAFESLHSELRSANVNSKTLRSELQSAVKGSEELRFEIQSELREADVSIRSEIQASADQILEQVTDEYRQEVADLESELEALREELDAPQIIKPRTVKDAAVLTTPFSESTASESSQSPTKNTAAKSPLTHFIFILNYV